MRPILAFAIALLMISGAATAQGTSALREALEARAAGDWDRATARAAAAGPLARDIIEWHRLRAKEGTFAETRAFLERHPDWPGLPYLRSRSEQSITEAASARDIISFFAPQLPRTGNGSLRLAQTLTAVNESEAARTEAVRAWTTHSMSEEEETAFLAAYGQTVAPFHAARADMLLWRGLTEQAERLLPRLSAGDAALTRARIALRENRDGLNALIAAVPAPQSSDPGLAFERFLWRATRGRTDSAIELISAQTELGQPEAWGNLRRRYARQLMREGADRRAYRLAANHGLSEGRHYADLEWLSGYIALRKLRDADQALIHFERVEKAVDTPISLARAQYWQARAHAAVGVTDAAQFDYMRAAQHQTAFYGLLAAEEIGVGMDPALIGNEIFPDWREAAWTDSSVYEAARLLIAAGDLSLGERFLTHLAESLTRNEIGQMVEMVREELREPHLEVMIGKRGVQYGHLIEGPYYALHPLADETGGVPPELALAVARRESEFDPKVVSPVGARGLMQLMVPTAREMASDLGVGFSEGRLTSDPAYNARLGLTFLAELQTRYGNSPVLISVAYNAGPSRADNWMASRGDPRRGNVDVVDWIEHIPFRETRNYVMRVTESLPVYRARLAGEAVPLNFEATLRGAMPSGEVSGPSAPVWAPTKSLRPQLRPAARATE
ncbi:MAG: transglycosylase SLT domain-containing protein [Rhodobacteraceae bacterium]|nr:transglycosylase SLT domain-containing protein [Paracoccaceae bacterium]